VKAGEIRDKPSLPAVANADMPFPIPSAWVWVRFANIVDFSAGRTPLRKETSFWNNGDHAWVSIADMEDGQVLTATKETVSDKARERVFGSEPEAPGTILMSFKLTIGKIARLGVPAFHNEAIISIRPHLAELDAYLFKILPQFARQGDTKGAIKGATLNRDSISNILFPLPPLAEQRRIVAKVDQLMALVDQLETQLTASRATAEKLMEAVVAALVKSEPSVASASVSDQKPAQSNLASIASGRSAKKKVSDEFVEAIVIAQLTRALATSKFPLGRMRYNKLAYLAHRKAEDDVMQRYLKKAAGPYSPWAKYGGPERIALKNGYIKNAKSGNYEGWIPGERVGDIDLYLPNYSICSAVSWTVAKLRYKKKEELELLATVDFAALELRTRGRGVTRETIKWIVSTNKEWAPKLSRGIFSDESIDKALAELAGLFPSHYA